MTKQFDNKTEPLQVQRYSFTDVDIQKVDNLFEGFFKVNEYHLSHKLFGGGQSSTLRREVFERGDAVVLMPYDAKLDNVILIEQFRPGALRSGESPWLLEFIAGMFDEHENPEEVAIREAKEEANLTVNKSSLVKVMNYFSSPGGMSERIYLYAANVDSGAINHNGIYGLPEEGEDILVHVLSRKMALTLLAQGKISNAATIIGLQWLALNYKTLQANWLRTE